MRRLPIAIAAAGLLAVAAGAATAALTLTQGAARVVTIAPQEADREPVFAVRAGEPYRFEVGYAVDGAERIGTGHLFTVEHAVTGERMTVASKSFPPEPPGTYTESSEIMVGRDWAAGVYRLRWTINARHTRLPSVHERGAHVFLVLAPREP
ncbi:hypothetical protein [Miltoncostaea marina]|uniref:hypothetical protein n=1 Tax=Miltoncostaea marina TaxID=2843215 RepID=UPI001C3C437F|nr:hypothetical protein [Miltoncostaea marina]